MRLRIALDPGRGTVRLLVDRALRYPPERFDELLVVAARRAACVARVHGDEQDRDDSDAQAVQWDDDVAYDVHLGLLADPSSWQRAAS